MIFTGVHWAAGVFQALLAAAEVLFAFGPAKKNRFVSRSAVLLVGIYFLVYKTSEYVIFEKPPVDFSALSYFLFGLAAVLPLRPLKGAAAYSGLLAGSLFVLTFTLAPETHFANMATPFLLAMAFVNHNFLFVGALCVLCSVRLRPRDLFAAAGFIAFVVVYSEIMVQVYGFTEGEVVTEIIDASVILYILPGFSFPWWYYAVYYVCAVSILRARGSRYINSTRACARKKNRADCRRHGSLPVFSYFCERRTFFPVSAS